MNVAKSLKICTLEEFEKLPKEDGWNYELLDGVVMMSPRPAMQHQIVSGNLYTELRNALRQKNCRPIPEIDLVLEGNNLIPDMMVICNDTFDKKRYEQPPFIVIEIVSPTSSSRDYVSKRNLYEKLNIPEYWVISPEEKCVDVFCFADKKHFQYCDGQLKSCILPEIVITLEDLFA